MAALQNRSWTSNQFIWKCLHNRQVWILQMLVHYEGPALGRVAVWPDGAHNQVCSPGYPGRACIPQDAASASAALKNVLVTEKNPAKLSTGLTILSRRFLSSWLSSPKICYLFWLGSLLQLGQIHKEVWDSYRGRTENGDVDIQWWTYPRRNP